MVLAEASPPVDHPASHMVLTIQTQGVIRMKDQ